MARLTFLLLLLWVGVAVSTMVDLQKRVIGGQPCVRQFHVRLRIVGPNGSCGLCGGSLISPQWILTAAHCFQQGGIIYAFFDVNGAVHRVQITANPVIYTDINHSVHDLMLLQLPQNANIPPVPLPDCANRPGISQNVEIAGHAAIRGGPNDERIIREVPILHCGNIQVVDCGGLIHTLQTNYQAMYRIMMYQRWFCGQSPVVDVCYGDSGGGLVYNGRIYGVFSFLGNHEYVCREAAAFMDLCNPDYNAWIRTTAGIP